MDEAQQIAVITFVERLFDDEGAFKDVQESDFVEYLNVLSQYFGFAVIKKHSKKRLSEEEKVEKIIDATEFLRRSGKKPTIKDITQIVGGKEEKVRYLMIKYNLYDPIHKKINDGLSFWDL